MIATKTFAIEPINFDGCMDKVTKIEPTAKTARSRSELIGVSENTYGTWKKRGTIPYQELVQLCIKKDVDLNWFFKGTTAVPVYCGSNEKQSDNNGITEENMKEAMKLISAEIERAQAPWSDEVLDAMIKTYFNYSTEDVDIKSFLRVVAELYVK